MPTAAIILDVTSIRSRRVAQALHTSLSKIGWLCHYRDPNSIESHRGYELVAGYGWRYLSTAYALGIPYIYLDLGFWDRRLPQDTTGGYYRLSHCSRFPVLEPELDRGDSRLLQQQPAQADYFNTSEKHVLVAGISIKAAISFGYEPFKWDLDTIRELKEAGADVIYRPKIAIGGNFLDRELLQTDIEIHNPHAFQIGHALRQVRAVATHHGHAAIDALLGNLPFYTKYGSLEPWSVRSPHELLTATPTPSELRRQLLVELTWHHWSLDELTRGVWLQDPAPISYLRRYHR